MEKNRVYDALYLYYVYCIFVAIIRLRLNQFCNTINIVKKIFNKGMKRWFVWCSWSFLTTVHHSFYSIAYITTY
jgi:hypothetical protein